MVTFEALQAKFGDCLLLRYQDKAGTNRLWIIDGGPSGIYNNILKPRLEALKRGLDSVQQLPVDVVLVSHIDDDHINGIGQMLRSLEQQKQRHVPLWLDIQDIWFNSFSKLVETLLPAAASPAGLASITKAVSAAKTASPVTTAVLASVGQGEALSSDIKSLGIKLNSPHPPLLSAPLRFTRDDAVVTVLGPLDKRLLDLQTDWQAAAGKPAALAAALDRAVPNLSSLAVLVEIDDRKLLLTGDARGDDLVEGWTANGGAPGQPCPVDVLKMPHHGSIRNTTEEFLKLFPAAHYVFSADGKFDNPDDATLKMLVDTQGNRPYAIHVTCPILEYGTGGTTTPSSRVDTLLRNAQAGRQFTYSIGAPVQITL